MNERFVLRYCWSTAEWAEPETIISLDEITDLSVNYNSSFFEDSMVFVSTASGIETTFPISSEHGLDKKFVEALQFEPSLPE